MPTSTGWPGTRTSRTASTSGTTAACTARTPTATAAGSTAPTCRGCRSTTWPSRSRRPNRIAIGLQDNGSNRSWSSVDDAVADPVAASWSSYGGGDGHYVVIDSADDTFYYSCSQNAGCSGVHDLVSTTTTLSAATAVGATNVKLASVTGLVVGNTITIDSTGANPETVTMTTVGTSGAGGTGVSFTPALAFAHASGATVVKNGVAGTQSLGFGSRGSGLRCTTDAPLVQDPANSATLLIGCNNLSRSTNRGANWTQIAAPDLLTGPAPATTRPRTTRSTRASSRRSRRSA